MNFAFISHPDCLLHDMGGYHPESPERLRVIEQAVKDAGLLPNILMEPAPNAKREHLLRIHSAAYIDRLFSESPEAGYVRLDPDVQMNPYSLKAALRAAGAGIHAVDLVMSEAVNAAFCNIRPPGHHAMKNKAMGFCLFNNIAIAAAHALERYQLQRVLIFDFDVHQGNGTVEAFEKEPRILYCSTFEYPFYPFTPAISDSPSIINMPLAAGTDSQIYRETVESQCLARIEAFQPEMVFFSAGFDAYIHDPLADLGLMPDDYFWVTEKIVSIAKQHCPGRIVSMLEGGYDLDGLGRCALAHIRALML